MHHNSKLGKEAMHGCNQTGFQDVKTCNNQSNKETVEKYALKFKGNHPSPATPDMQPVSAQSADTSVSVSSRSTTGSSGYDADGEMSSRSEIATNMIKRAGVKQRKTVQQRNHPTTKGKTNDTSTSTATSGESESEHNPTP